MEPSEIKSKVRELIAVLDARGLTLCQIERILGTEIKQCRVNRYLNRDQGVENQTWKTVRREGYDQYLVSNSGFVRHKTKIKYLKPAAEHQYARAPMKAPQRASRKAGGQQHMIHELVYESFVLEATLASCGIKKGIEVINHIDGDKWNPALDNLELTDQGSNMLHAYSMNLRASTKRWT